MWKRGRSGWHSWSVPNVGFSRRFSSHWQLSSSGQWSDPQTLEIPRMPAVETQGLVCPVDYCLSGSMTSSVVTLWLGLGTKTEDFLSVQEEVILSLAWCFTGVCSGKKQALLLLIVPSVERRVKFSLLNFPSFPPCCSGCMNSGEPLFQFNRGQRAERRGLLSHTESNNTLTDNVTHNMRQNEEGAETGVWIVTQYQASVRKSRPQYLKCLSKGVTALVWNHWSELKQTHTMPPTHTQCY